MADLLAGTARTKRDHNRNTCSDAGHLRTSGRIEELVWLAHVPGKRTIHIAWFDGRRQCIYYEDTRKTVPQRAEEALVEFILDRGDEIEARFKGAHVYFMGADDGPVKIGKSACVAARREDIQVSHSSRIRVLAAVRGSFALERAYHKRFAAHRLEGEWFERAPEIVAEIERLSVFYDDGRGI